TSPLTPGIDPRPGGDSNFWQSSEKEVLLSQDLADQLHVRPGDSVKLHLQKTAAIPRETLLGRRDASEVLSELNLKVKAVLPADSFGSRFSLNPNPTTPRNAFVPLRLLQEDLGQKGRVNALLVRGGSDQLQQDLAKHLSLDDWGLVLWDAESRTQSLFDKLDRNRDGQLSRAEWRDRLAHGLADLADEETGVISRDAVHSYYRNRGYLSLESRQLLLQPAVVEAALRAASKAQLRSVPTLVYLVNSIASNRKECEVIAASLDP